MGVRSVAPGARLSGPFRSRSDMQRADTVHLELLIARCNEEGLSRQRALAKGPGVSLGGWRRARAPHK